MDQYEQHGPVWTARASVDCMGRCGLHAQVFWRIMLKPLIMGEGLGRAQCRRGVLGVQAVAAEEVAAADAEEQ